MIVYRSKDHLIRITAMTNTDSASAATTRRFPLTFQLAETSEALDLRSLMPTFAFSAPGKVLVAGGYLVLDPQYKAYVTALLSRMHAVSSIGDPSPSPNTHSIRISLPQFQHGSWLYTCPVDRPTDLTEHSTHPNPFAASTVSTLMAYASPATPCSLSITVYSDPSYHAQDPRGCKTHSLANSSKEFAYHSSPIHDVPKTGLGLSAGLVTVLVASILPHLTSVSSLSTLHNLAQIAHCKAQRKVGLGFDVAAAVYGSIVYRRFDPSPLLALFAVENALQYAAQLRKLVDSEWNFTHTPCALPPRLRLVVGDVSAGLSTPQLVATVMRWRQENPADAQDVYSELDRANSRTIKALADMNVWFEQSPTEYTAAIDSFLAGSEATGPLAQLVLAMRSMREQLQRLLRLSGASIEPPEQTELLDACQSLAGHVGGLVPGAGGYDAICLLMASDGVSSLDQQKANDDRFKRVHWLSTCEQTSGLVAERASDYAGLP